MVRKLQGRLRGVVAVALLAALASLTFVLLGSPIQSSPVGARAQLQVANPQDALSTGGLLLGSVSLSALLPEAGSAPAEAHDFFSSLEAATVRAERSRELSRDATNLFAAEAGGEGDLYLYALDPKTRSPIASVNASTKVVAASTHKLFVAYSMILAVEDGSASWADPLLPGWSLG